MKILNQKIWNSLSENLKDYIYGLENEFEYNDCILSFKEDNYSGLGDELEEYVESCKVEYAAGASKICVWDDNSDYVVKAPLIYQTWYDGKDDEYKTDWQGDYIEEDVKCYHSYPMRSILAKNYPLVLLGKLMGHDIVIYAQDRCLPAYNDTDENIKWFSPKSKEIVENYYMHCPFSKEWMNRFCQVYGEKEADEFFNNYADKNEYRLSDMSCNNYGYSYNEGLPIIFDYSGYGKI